MYQQERGKNDVNKTESLKHNFPKIFFIQLTIPRTSFSRIESNRTFPSVGGYKSSINHRFSFFFFSIVSTRIGAISSIRSLSLFSPPAFNGGKGWKKRRPCFGISSPPPTDYFVNEEGQTCFHARSVCGCACMKFSFQIVPLTLTVYEWPLMKT